MKRLKFSKKYRAALVLFCCDVHEEQRVGVGDGKEKRLGSSKAIRL